MTIVPEQRAGLTSEEMYELATQNTLKVMESFIRRSGEWLTLPDFARHAGVDEQTVLQWEKQGHVFAVPYEDERYYPAFAVASQAARPKPGLHVAPETFRAANKPDWDLAFWLCSANSWLGGMRPADVLHDNVEDLCGAAVIEIQGILHG